MQCLRYHQIYTYAYTMSTYLRYCLTYMRQVTTHTLDNVDAATTSILSPDILPVAEFGAMLRHIKVQLHPVMHLPISSNSTFHFNSYLMTNVFVADGQFLLLIYVPIQSRAQELQIYEIFNLSVPHGALSAKYKINNKYFGVTYDEMQTVLITEEQYSTCLHANGQFCKIYALF